MCVFLGDKFNGSILDYIRGQHDVLKVTFEVIWVSKSALAASPALYSSRIPRANQNKQNAPPWQSTQKPQQKQARGQHQEKDMHLLVHVLVTSRLDYCNALLYGLPHTMLKRLQRVQNCAARLICRRKKHDHVTPLLKELHWLPIHVRPTYKLLTIAYSVMHGLAPEYLANVSESE